MELNLKSTHISKEMLNNEKNLIHAEIIENLHYLYPNGHRITPQMRWFKGSRDIGFKSDNAA